MRRPNRRPVYLKTEDIENYETEADYIVYKDGVITVALNGHTGKEDSRNTDSATVIQYAIDNLPAVGGFVFIKPGRYTITTKITLCKNLTLAGAGGIYNGATDLRLDDNVDDDVIYYNPDAPEVSNVTIRDISLYGNRDNQASGHGIHFGNNTGDIGLMRVGIKICKEHGFYSERPWGLMMTNCVIEYCDGDAIRATGSNDARIVGNKVGASGGYGIYLTGANHKITGNHIFGSDEAGLYVYAKQTAITGNMIQNNKGTTDDCQIYLRGDNIVVVGNTIDAVAETGYGIVLRTGTDDCYIAGNSMVNYATARILDPGARNLYNGLSISRGAPETQLDTGTAESGTTEQLTDTDQTWVGNEWQGCMVEITAGAAVGDVRGIYENTDVKLNVSPSFSVAIDNTSVYKIWDMWKFTAEEGAIVRDTTGNKTYIYAGGGWREISAL